MARYEREQREREAKARAELNYYSPMLALFGVRTVTAAFDGYGDDGEFENPVYSPPPPAGLPDGLDRTLQWLFAQFLPGGWEINAGTFGTVTFDVASSEASVEIEAREEEEYDDDNEDDDTATEDR